LGLEAMAVIIRYRIRVHADPVRLSQFAGNISKLE
jgi:hypothetical protein